MTFLNYNSSSEIQGQHVECYTVQGVKAKLPVRSRRVLLDYRTLSIIDSGYTRYPVVRDHVKNTLGGSLGPRYRIRIRIKESPVPRARFGAGATPATGKTTTSRPREIRHSGCDTLALVILCGHRSRLRVRPSPNCIVYTALSYLFQVKQTGWSVGGTLQGLPRLFCQGPR